MKHIREKRRHERIKKHLDVEYSGQYHSGRGRSKNISPGGLLLGTHERCEPGDHINLSIYLPNGSISHIKGIVRHASESAADQHDVGVEFVELDEAFTTFISELVDEIRAEDLICPSCGAEYNLTQERVNLAHRCRLCGVLLELK